MLRVRVFCVYLLFEIVTLNIFGINWVLPRMHQYYAVKEPQVAEKRRVNELIDAFCRMDDYAVNHMEWLLDVEFGPSTRQNIYKRSVAYYDSQLKMVVSVARPDMAHPEYQMLNKQFKKLTTYFLDKKYPYLANNVNSYISPPQSKYEYYYMDRYNNIKYWCIGRNLKCNWWFINPRNVTGVQYTKNNFGKYVYSISRRKERTFSHKN